MISKPINSSAGVYYRKIQLYMKKEFKALGISFDEGVVIQNVFFNPGTTQDAIAKTLALDPAAVARSLKSLEAAEYVTREIDMTNQRKKNVTITTKGKQIVKKIISLLEKWDSIIFEGMSEEATQKILEAMHFLQQRAEAIEI